MVNDVLDSISKALYTTFGNKYTYYIENIEQNTKLPCFNIGVLNPLSRSTNSKDYYWTVPCVLHYFTNNKQTNLNEKYSIGAQTMECLEYLQIGKQLVRAEDMSMQIVDDALQVFLTYRFWTEKEQPVLDGMEGVEIAPTRVIE